MTRKEQYLDLEEDFLIVPGAEIMEEA